MLTRTDAMAAKEGMERYKSTEMQLRVSILSILRNINPFSNNLLTLFCRHAGGLALDLATAATIRPALASYLLTDLPTQIANGC